jgi:hypothetical protein
VKSWLTAFSGLFTACLCGGFFLPFRMGRFIIYWSNEVENLLDIVIAILGLVVKETQKNKK